MLGLMVAARQQARQFQARIGRWRNQFSGLKAEYAKRLKDLEREKATLKRLLAEAELQKAALKSSDGNLWFEHANPSTQKFGDPFPPQREQVDGNVAIPGSPGIIDMAYWQQTPYAMRYRQHAATVCGQNISANAQIAAGRMLCLRPPATQIYALGRMILAARCRIFELILNPRKPTREPGQFQWQITSTSFT